MDQLHSTEVASSTTTTENPIVVVGRKVKSALSRNSNQPSVRIFRNTTSRRQSQGTPITEGRPEKRDTRPNAQAFTASSDALPNDRREKGGNSFTNQFRSLFSKENTKTEQSHENEYDTDTVDLLDVVDPEVATLSTLTNVQNSLFVPSIGRLVNRRPIYRIQDNETEARTIDKIKTLLKKIPTVGEDDGARENKAEGLSRKKCGVPANPLPNAQYAIRPGDEWLEDFTNEDKAEVDDLVRHELHSKRAKFKRSIQGFKQYVRRPLGLFITVYATLITLFGAAWVFFLIGWISIGSKQDYVVNIVDNVLVALFAIIGDGLAPFRAVDTYHMIYIAHYHHKTWKRRDKLGLPQLIDNNDLPDQRREQTPPTEIDLESLVAKRFSPSLARRIAPRIPKRIATRMLAHAKTPSPTYEYSVLTATEQAKLEYHERKFSKSHTFYKPHETETHYAFPLKLLIAVVILLDCHSMLQISLGACTWGINYKTRPFALTTVILCFSITCNILGGVLISRGDKQTRKQAVIERMMTQELTSTVIQSIRTRKLKEAEARGELSPEYRKRMEEEKEEMENEEIKKSWKSVPLLPKKLLGKGEDHRQPSLRQKERSSTSDVTKGDVRSAPSSSLRIKRKEIGSGSGSSLPALREEEQVRYPEPVIKRGEIESPKQGTGQKIMGFIRKADMDRS